MKVSVVIAVYNGTWCIERALDSLIAQTRRPDEILVCDDGSTDGTADLIERRYGNAVTVLRLPHNNAAVTRRVGLDRAIGDWIAFMDADDTWLPAKLERQLDFIARNPEVRLVTCDGAYISAEGVIRESWFSDYFHPLEEIVGDLFTPLIERCFVLLSATMVERKAYDEAGGLDTHRAYSYDYDLWLRVLARHPGALLLDRLTTYWFSSGALSRNIEARYRDDLEIMRRVESGVVPSGPEHRRRASERAAALEFDLALICMRSNRLAEGRERMARAAGHGPFTRRCIASAGRWMPDWAVSRLMRSSWLKSTVQQAREPIAKVTVEGEGRRAA